MHADIAVKDQDELTRPQKAWALLAALIFVASLAWLGLALATHNALIFAIGWPVLQVIGYTGSLRRAKGDTAHPLFITQVMLNLCVIGLIAAILMRPA